MLKLENTLSLTLNLFLRILLQKIRFRIFPTNFKEISKFLDEENENQTQKESKVECT